MSDIYEDDELDDVEVTELFSEKFADEDTEPSGEVTSGSLRLYLTGIVTGILLLALAMLICDFFGIHPLSRFKAADAVYDRAKVVESYIDRYYWKSDTTDDEFADYAAKGMVDALGDPYSVYLTASELESSKIRTEGDYAGIGCTISMQESTGRKYVTVVDEGKAADKAGLKVGDEIILLDGKDVVDMSVDEMAEYIRGEEGKKVVLTVMRAKGAVSGSAAGASESGADSDASSSDGDTSGSQGERERLEITIVTELIVHQSIYHQMLKNKTGYLQITNFDKESVDQFKEAIDDLKSQGMTSLIIDVRNNGGGVLTSTISMLDYLLPAGDLITETRKGSKDKVYKSTDENSLEIPMVVLINGNSASASEVFAGCLKDRGAATLIGEKSFGKGIVQTIYSISEKRGDGIKLTTGQYLLPSGRSIHEVGLEPDVKVEYTGTSDDYGTNDDNQLMRAMEYLENIMED